MSTRSTLLFKNARIVTPQGIIEKGSVIVSDGKIDHIISNQNVAEWMHYTFSEVIDVQGNYLAPGFIDVHMHGGGGYDVMSGLPSDLESLSRYVASKGVTSFLATTLTAERNKLELAVAGIASTIKQGTSGAEIVGIHLEGPFLNIARCGAQSPHDIRLGTLVEMQAYLDLADGNIRLMTIAPEFKENREVIRLAVQQGITISIGHSDATWVVVKEAIAEGATHVTHLFNGMSPLHHREPGVAGSALFFNELAVELICDGIHVHRELIAYVFRTKPLEKIILITDAMSAAGCPDGIYSLGSLAVKVSGGSVRSREDGGLAGSILAMDQVLRNVMEFTGYPMEQIMPAMTINPAKQIGIAERKGTIEAGKDADLVILNESMTVVATYVKGRCVYHALEVEQR